MVHDKQPEYENLFHALPEDESLSIDGGDVVFFKGEKCPLSNYYYCDDCCQMDFCAVVGDDDDDDLHTHDSDYHKPELRYGAQQAFAALKARKMGLDVCYRKIVSPRNASQLHAAIRQMECHIRGGQGGLWKMTDMIKTMYRIIKEKWYCMPPFKSYCAALGSKYPCEVTSNEFWACGLDMQVLRSLDSQLRPHHMKGKNILGWIIKIVKSQFGTKINYLWVDQALEMSSLSASVKDRLWDVLTALKLKKYAISGTFVAVKRKSSPTQDEEEASSLIKKKKKKKEEEKIGCRRSLLVYMYLY